jgi:MFS transporter, DHA1 family, multidrug resistance protein
LASAIMFFGAAFVFPLSMGKGMGIFRHISGTSNATMYLINVLITSLHAFLASFFVVQNMKCKGLLI